MRFTTNAYPKEQRREAWRFALKRVSLLLDEADETLLYGELIQVRSRAGFSFVRVTGTAQSWSEPAMPGATSRFYRLRQP